VLVELADDFRFSTGARSGNDYERPFSASKIVADGASRRFVITAREPAEKLKGVDIMLELPYEVVPSLMEAILRSLTTDKD
jgi:hypothetical protein